MKPSSADEPFDFDYVVIGSGFGGSASACRLAQKGYRVAVFEMGKRYEAHDFPKTNWNLRKFFWWPLAKLHGFFRMTIFRHAWVLSGVGVGGGSLVYGNTLLEPPENIWEEPRWNALADWGREMPEHFRTAKHMLGVVDNPYRGAADQLLLDEAKRQGCADTYYQTRVGVYFGEAGKTVPDPYFQGKGPPRTGCVYCGGCMVGCRFGAKNTLDKNYLYFAERSGAAVIPESEVVDVKPITTASGRQGYTIAVQRSTAWLRKRRRQFSTTGVVFAAGVIGTVSLLSKLKQAGSLPHLSDRIGHFVRTNSESIVSFKMKGKHVDMSDGIAIGSGIHLSEDTHIEAVRYPHGSDAMNLTATLMPPTAPSSESGRFARWVRSLLLHPLRALRAAWPRHFAKRTLILLAMQTASRHISMVWKRSWVPPFRRRLKTQGPKIPTYIPEVNHFVERMNRTIKGTPMTALTEVLLDVPTTAHILGGATMGRTPEEGVIDAQNRVFGYREMYVCDGSMIGANLGVNPSLTITALTERAMSRIPHAPGGDAPP